MCHSIPGLEPTDRTARFSGRFNSARHRRGSALAGSEWRVTPEHRSGWRRVRERLPVMSNPPPRPTPADRQAAMVLPLALQMTGLASHPVGSDTGNRRWGSGHGPMWPHRAGSRSRPLLGPLERSRVGNRPRLHSNRTIGPHSNRGRSPRPTPAERPERRTRPTPSQARQAKRFFEGVQPSKNSSILVVRTSVGNGSVTKNKGNSGELPGQVRIPRYSFPGSFPGCCRWRPSCGTSS